tara:strand:- start:104281 stop:105273 length:993 start_codon:yes stop_codon:yes gene_type:complete
MTVALVFSPNLGPSYPNNAQTFSKAQIRQTPILAREPGQKSSRSRTGAVAALKIENNPTGVTTLQQTRRAEDKNIQTVFSEVLRHADRAGYASASSIESDQPLDILVQESWNSWYQVERLGRYRSPEAPQDLGESFGGILQKAYDANAYVDPKSFLKGLSASELKSVQNTHWLADPINVDSLTEEGALNLLIPSAAQVDLNHDGLTQSGLSYGIRFPDSLTPPDVAAAWEEVTDGMAPMEVALFELRMKLPVLTSNIVLDADGRFLHQRSPGDPDFVNPMNAEDYSFIQVTKDWIGHLEYLKNQIEPERFARDMDFWQRFQGSLQRHGAT